jgi:3-oxoacyl-[acyl-carrier protein] reductase
MSSVTGGIIPASRRTVSGMMSNIFPRDPLPQVLILVHVSSRLRERAGNIMDYSSRRRLMVSTIKDLQGRVALVTGASRNIGRAIACALARDGANIAVHAAHDREAAEETAGLVRAYGVKAFVTMGDLSEPDTARRIVSNVYSEYGRLDVLINNAAIRPETPFAEMTYQDWRSVLGVCLDAVFLTSHAALEHIGKSDRGCIINIGGLTGHTGAAHRAHVITAKAGIVGFTKALAHELSAQGITVNCVSPGLIETIRADGGSPQHHASTKNLVQRRGRPEEVADAIAFLCSHQARYITGQTIHLNGGAFLP